MYKNSSFLGQARDTAGSFEWKLQVFSGEESSASAHIICICVILEKRSRSPHQRFRSEFWHKKEEGGSYRRQEAKRAKGGIYTSLVSGPEHNVPRLAVEYPASGTSLSSM